MLQKHKLDHITARNIRISLGKRVAFSKQSYAVSEEKRTRTNIIAISIKPVIPVIRNLFGTSYTRLAEKMIFNQ